MNEFERLDIKNDKEDKELIQIEESKNEILNEKEYNAYLWKERNALVSLMLLQEELNRHG